MLIVSLSSTGPSSTLGWNEDRLTDEWIIRDERSTIEKNTDYVIIHKSRGLDKTLYIGLYKVLIGDVHTIAIETRLWLVGLQADHVCWHERLAVKIMKVSNGNRKFEVCLSSIL